MRLTLERPTVSQPARSGDRRSLAERALIGVVVFQGVTATAGGAAIVAGESGLVDFGDAVVLPEEWLDLVPFDSWLVPGIILGAGLGLGALVVGWGLVREPDVAVFEPLERATGHHWSWTGALALGTGLLAWIGVQLALLPGVSWLQALYGSVGATITGLASTPAVRRRLRRPDH